MEQFFNDPQTLIRLRQGPLAPYLDSFAKLLRDEGYATLSARDYLPIIADFSRWLKLNRVAVHQITSEHTGKYMQYRDRKQYAKRRGTVSTLRRLLNFLRHAGVIANEVTLPITPIEKLTQEFVVYLRKERALAAATIKHYRRSVTLFLTDKFTGQQVDLGGLCSADIVGFVQRQAATLHIVRNKQMATVLRSFLQYARYQNYIKNDLAAAVPTVANWSMTSIPKALPRDQVELVLSKCNHHTAIGRRDYAILLLLARLGLRACEVASLTLEDIDWQAGHISVHGKNSHRRLPLPTEVGEAIAAYLRDGRPKTNSRAVFIRACAPVGPFKESTTISAAVARALARAGIDTPRKGAHQLRHSLATDLLGKGASLSEIGELLGHRSPKTTAIYAKVDLAALRALALAWPGGVQ